MGGRGGELCIPLLILPYPHFQCCLSSYISGSDHFSCLDPGVPTQPLPWFCTPSPPWPCPCSHSPCLAETMPKLQVFNPELRPTCLSSQTSISTPNTWGVLDGSLIPNTILDISHPGASAYVVPSTGRPDLVLYPTAHPWLKSFRAPSASSQESPALSCTFPEHLPHPSRDSKRHLNPS